MYHSNHIETIECARTEGFSAGQSYVKANGKTKAYAEAKRLGDECPNPDAKSFGYIDGFMKGVLSSPCVNDREFSVDGQGYFNFKPMPKGDKMLSVKEIRAKIESEYDVVDGIIRNPGKTVIA